MRRAVRHLARRVDARVLVVLVAGLMIVGGVWGFVELLDEVQEGDTQRFDELAIRALAHFHGDRYRWLEEVGRDITALGGVAILAVLTLGVVGFLIMVRKFGAMWLVIAATVGGLTLSQALKWLVDRPRPQLVEHLSHVYTSSFPSGHSMMSTVVLLTLGSLLATVVEGRRLKLYVLSVALILSFLVGVSRVYMAVHWPTDVLAGWTAGLVWAILCWLVARQLQRRGAIESDQPAPKGR